ncbi:MAG: MBOAT family protein [Verrucomicrobia bacterium]|nr:MBOAT family protein [Verrucomicrobiota bacterium]
MSFISWQYAFLLTGVFALYWQLAWRGRIWLLLATSYFFYGFWDARFLALHFTTTIVDFYAALAMGRQRVAIGKVAAMTSIPAAWLLLCKALHVQGHDVSWEHLLPSVALPVIFCALYSVLWRLPETKQRRAFLLLSLASNLVVLGFFKYCNFFAGSLVTGLQTLGWDPGWTLPHILLPVGISFYTFQAMSYTIDVYRGDAKPVADFPLFAAFLAFFPQLVAGPIERAHQMLPQFQTPRAWDTAALHRGARLILLGLFKKVFVADNCALLASHAFDPKTALDAPWALLGVLAFAMQIYGDFSGYTDLARGSAQMLGIKLNDNFRLPYFAQGPSDFWRRWHITLSSWFRDYVYIPLGGNRGGAFATLRNLWLTMLVAGLWHGANWTFVLWGAYHGALLILYRLVPPLRAIESAKSGWRVPLGVALMFALTLVGWAVFRCGSLAQLGNWFAAFAHPHVVDALPWRKPALWLALHAVPLLVIQFLTRRKQDEVEISAWPWPARGVAYAAMFVAVASSAGGDVDFIYFQF